MTTPVLPRRIPTAAFGLLALWLAACSDEHHRGSTDGHGKHDHAPATRTDTGPHGGRVLVDGDFALEITIFERGVAPELRLYARRDGTPIAPSELDVSVALTRINGLAGGRTDRHVFTPREDYLVSGAEVYEPHSFTVTVDATHAGRRYHWTYEAPEAQARIHADIAAAQGVRTSIVSGGTIAEHMQLYGVIAPDPQRQRRVAARYPGPVRSVAAQLGDLVEAGQTLASIESNESLQVYTIAAPIRGIVTQRAINAGELADVGTLFEITDLSRVWAQLSIFPRDLARIRSGQSVRIEGIDGSADEARIDHLSPLSGRDQSVSARVPLDNPQARWRPGQFVSATVVVDTAPASLVVPLSAVQRLRDWDVVFVVDGDTYQALPVTLGRRDAEHVEILHGLEPGARIVVDNSYLVKADIEKSGAAHDH